MLKEKKGSILSFVMVAFSLVVTFSLALASSSLIQNAMANRETASEQAFLSAKSMSEYLTVTESDVIETLALKPLNSELVLIDENHKSYQQLGRVSIRITNTYVDNLQAAKKYNIEVIAEKEGISSTIKSVWRQALQPAVGGDGLSFASNFLVSDCIADSETGFGLCENSTVKPKIRNLVEENPNLETYTVDEHTLLTHEYASFSATKVTQDEQIQRYKDAYKEQGMLTENEYKNIKHNCIVPSSTFPQMNFNNISESVKNKQNCIIDTKDDKDPVSSTTNRWGKAVIFEIPENTTMTVFVNIHKDNSVDPLTVDLTSWEQNVVFYVMGKGTLNIVYDYQSNNGKAKSIFLPEIYQKNPEQTEVNIFFPQAKEDDKLNCETDKKCSVIENVVMVYGYAGSNQLTSAGVAGYGKRDGSVDANIYMPYSNLVINGLYRRNADSTQTPDVEAQNRPVLNGEIVTNSVYIYKAKSDFYTNPGSIPTYQAGNGNYFTSKAWRITSKNTSSNNGQGAITFEVYKD
ncbi:MAG: hypothetical protein ACRCZJ_01765 [Erysipelotrichaceae bacterium]